MYIYVIRHGETEWNQLGKVQGRTDVLLNSEGRNQAKKISLLFKGCSFDSLITSPLSRAIETGILLTTHAHVEKILQDDKIIEKSYGITEGWKGTERYRIYPHGHAPGEESYKIVRKRMREAIESYARTYTKDVLVVSHGSAIAAMIKELEPSLEKDFLKIDNCSITIIDSKTLQIVAWNLDYDDTFK